MMSGLLTLAILVIVVVMIVRAFSEQGKGTSGEAAGVVIRRFFLYALLLGVVSVVALGLSGLIEAVLPEPGEPLAGGNEALIARSLAFVVIGGPILYLLVRFTRSRLASDAAERASLGWAFYLTIVSIVAVVVTMTSAFETLRWAFDLDPFDAASVSRGLVWAAVWAIHWPLTRSSLPARRNELHVLLGSAIGLLASAVALGVGLTTIFEAAYDSAFATAVSGGYSDTLLGSLAGAIVGLPVWWWYWLRHAASIERRAAWHVYVVLLGILGGFVVMIGGVATMLYVSLEWIFGEVGISAAAHFDVTPSTAVAIILGAVVYWYHRGVLQDSPSEERSEVDRVYDYILAAVGLVAAASGIVTVIVALIDSVTNSAASVNGSSVEILLGAVTLLLVGAPLWWFFWTRIQHHASSSPEVELRSPTRRSYLFLLFGIGAVVTVINLIVLAFIGFEDVIEGTFDSGTLFSMRAPIALVLTMGGIALYHWSVYQEDRAQAPQDEQALREVLVLSADGHQVAQAIAARTGAKVKVWKRLDDVAQLDAEEVIAAVAGADHERVLVLAGPAGVEVVPFED